MRDERNKAKTKIVSPPRSQKQKEDDVHFVVDEKGKIYIYIARTGAVSSSPRPPRPPPTGTTIFVARFVVVVVVGVCLW